MNTPRTITRVSDKYHLTNAILYGQMLINGVNYIYDKSSDTLTRQDVHLQRIAQIRNSKTPQLGIEF